MSVLEVDLKAIKKNIEVIKLKLNKNQKFCLVAKANAYGLGDEKVCKYLDGDVDYFAVSSAEEFLSLKKKVTKPIMILDPIYENIKKCARIGAIFCIANNESLERIINCAKVNNDICFFVSLAINTGMNRFGFCNEKEVFFVLEKIKKMQNISILGAFSHYFEANNKNYAKIQFNKFSKIEKLINKNYKKNNVVFHIANSDGIVYQNGFDMVRVGIAAYLDSEFETIRLKSKIIDFQTLNKGESAGYNRQFVATKVVKVAIVAIGYADGIFRNIVKKGYVLINGNYCKIVAICMDSIIVDVTNVCCKIYDDVTLIGRDKDKQIFVCDLAAWCDTISYEVLTHITKRVKRKYLKG